MISKSQLRLLSHLTNSPQSETSIDGIADQLDWSIGHTSRVVSELESYGRIRTRKAGRKKLVTLSNIEPVEQLGVLVNEYSHIDFPDLIAGSGLQLLYYLDSPQTATELSELSGLSRATAYRRLNELQLVGIIGKRTSNYRLNSQFSSLSSIARGIAHHKHRREAESYTDNINIVWETHNEYLFACRSGINSEKFHQTGPSFFAEFEIPLMTRNRQHYFRGDQNRVISPAELVCHTLLINDEPRYRIYCLLLITGEEIGRRTLRESAEYYEPEADIDLLRIVDGLVAYLNTKGRDTSSRLPSWEDFKSSAADYDISV